MQMDDIGLRRRWHSAGYSHRKPAGKAGGLQDRMNFLGSARSEMF
jgi:hypothetical protein